MTSISNISATTAAPVTLGEPVAPKPKLNIVDDRTATIRTSAGRHLTIKRLSVVEKMRLAKALGEHSGNDSYSNFAVVAAAVR